MSFSITLTGSHSDPGSPHQEEVKALALEAYWKLANLEGVANVTLSGYVNDGKAVDAEGNLIGAITLETPEPETFTSSGEVTEIKVEATPTDIKRGLAEPLKSGLIGRLRKK